MVGLGEIMFILKTEVCQKVSPLVVHYELKGIQYFTKEQEKLARELYDLAIQYWKVENHNITVSLEEINWLEVKND